MYPENRISGTRFAIKKYSQFFLFFFSYFFQGLFGGGELGDLYGGAQMANHVPRLGRRSKNPYLKDHNRNAFRFFGETGDRTGSSAAQHRNLAGLFSGPLFRNFRFHGGSSNDDLMRGLLRDKRIGINFCQNKGKKFRQIEFRNSKNS